ncbi:MAG: ATP-binding protein [Lachnospiraceae bacterium]|nr:ATP-binding protein [Lachnospiraceae bacterium]
MALNDQQYREIMRQYEQTRDHNRMELDRRREEVYHKVPAYQELEASFRSSSLNRLQSLLNGDDTALASIHGDTEHNIEKKKALLTQAGFPEDYLEPVYECPFCKDTGYIDNSGSPKGKCQCLKQKEISLLYEQSHLREVISQENFDTLSYTYYQGEDLEHFKKAAQVSKDFVQNFVQDYHNLFFYGTVGTGKSFLSGCIANELIKSGQYVIYFSSIDLFETLAHYTFDHNEKQMLYDLQNDIYDCDLLIIDDLGTESTNSFVSTQLFNCLNERHLRHKATVISTNLSLEALRDRYSDRIFSRITGNYTLCKLSGPDIRMRKKLSNIHE